MKIVIAKDFSETPGARYRDDGDFSGEEFRDDFLEIKYNECLTKGERLIINFDGCYGYSTGFLEEAIGGLIRKGYSLSEFKKIVTFISEEDKRVIEQVLEYMKDADQNITRKLKI